MCSSLISLDLFNFLTPKNVENMRVMFCTLNKNCKIKLKDKNYWNICEFKNKYYLLKNYDFIFYSLKIFFKQK